jgi:hypothetical protein
MGGDGINNDVKAVEEGNWKHITRNRQIWQALMMKTMAQEGMFYHC